MYAGDSKYGSVSDRFHAWGAPPYTYSIRYANPRVHRGNKRRFLTRVSFNGEPKISLKIGHQYFVFLKYFSLKYSTILKEPSVCTIRRQPEELGGLRLMFASLFTNCTVDVHQFRLHS